MSKWMPTRLRRLMPIRGRAVDTTDAPPAPTAWRPGECPLTYSTSDGPDDFVALIHSLKRSNLVRRQALCVAHNEPVLNIEPLLESLRNAWPTRLNERRLAAWALGCGQYGDEHRERVNSTLGMRIDRAVTIVLDRWLRTVLIGLLVIALSLMSIIPGYLSYAVGLLWMGVFACFAVLAGSDRRDSLVRAECIHALSSLRARGMVGRIAAAIAPGDPCINAAAKSALTELLPLIDHDLFGTFDRRELDALASATTHVDASLQKLLIEALAAVGDGKTVPWVETMAIEGSSVEVQIAAAAALLVLRERLARESQSGTLVRAASTSPDQSTQMLRPASDIDATPSTLLRAAAQISSDSPGAPTS